MFSETAPCPKCGNLCQLPKGGYGIVYVLTCILCVGIGLFADISFIVAFIIGGVICILLALYQNSIKNGPIQCPKCDFNFRR